MYSYIPHNCFPEKEKKKRKKSGAIIAPPFTYTRFFLNSRVIAQFLSTR